MAKSLKRKLEAPGALDNVPFADDKIKVLEIAIDEKCPIVNTELQKLTKTYSKLNANVLGVVRNGKFVILKKQDKIIHWGTDDEKLKGGDFFKTKGCDS